MDQMSSIAPGAIAGVIAALTATAIAGNSEVRPTFAARRQDGSGLFEKYCWSERNAHRWNLRTHAIPICTNNSGNVLRAAQYRRTCL